MSDKNPEQGNDKPEAPSPQSATPSAPKNDKAKPDPVPPPTSATAPAVEASAATAVAAGPPAAAPASTAGQPPTVPAQQEALIGSWLADNMHRTDVPYLVLVVVIAFFLGSFAARNAEVWLHLGTGRALSEGRYTLGEDPFGGIVVDGVERTRPWVNHSWLYSWIAYLLCSGSGELLVVLKALAAAGLAGVLLLIRPRNRHAWAGTLCVLLGVLAASQVGFELHPRMVSLLFLGLTLFVLYRAGVLAKLEPPAAQPKLLWALPPLFALWVNLDSWFIFGPIIVFCCLLGLLLDVSLGTKPHFAVGQLSLIFVVGLLACLLNPNHVKGVLLLPTELSYLLVRMGNFWPESMTAGGRALLNLHNFESKFERNGLFAPTLSPISGNFWSEPSQGLNVAGISFYVLLVLVLLSFYLSKLSGSAMLLVRGVPTVLSGVLALFLVQFIPLFAVVGAVVALLNVQEFLAWRETTQPAKIEEQNLWANMIRLVMGFVFFGLLLLCWPGWINSAVNNFSSPRQAAWKIEPDPSLRDTALFLKEKQAGGDVKRAVNFNRNVASYCAWYAPDMRFLTDQRLQLLDREVQTYLRIRAEFDQVVRFQSRTDPAAFRDALKKLGLDCLVSSTDLPPAMDLFIVGGLVPGILAGPPLESIYADGKMVVMKFQRPAGPISILQQQWRAQAFGLREAPWPERIASVEDPGFWGLYAQGLPQPSLLAQKSIMTEQVFSFLGSNIHRATWFNADKEGKGKWLAAPVMEVGMLNLANLGAGPLPVLFAPQERYMLKIKVDPKNKEFAQGLMMQAQRQGDAATYRALDAAFFGQQKSGVDMLEFPIRWGSTFLQDRGPPELAVVGIRSARQAVADSPQDYFSHRVYAHALRFIDQHQESFWTARRLNLGLFRGEPVPMQGSGMRSQLRKFQYVAALQRSVRLRPQDWEIHYELFQYFMNEKCIDLALQHLESSCDLIESSRIEQKKTLESQRNELKQWVAARETAFESAVKPTDNVILRADAAMNKKIRVTGPDNKTEQIVSLGLYDKARKLLLEFIAEQRAKKDAGKQPDAREQAEAEGALTMLFNIGLVTGNVWDLDTLMQRSDNDADSIKNLETQPLYHFNRFFYFGVVGDYGEADKALQEFERLVSAQAKKGMIQDQGLLADGKTYLPSFAHKLVADLFTFHQPHVTPLPALAFASLYDQSAQLVAFENANVLQRCESLTLRGILALEVGKTRDALELFKEALRQAGPKQLFLDRGIAERYVELLEGKF